MAKTRHIGLFMDSTGHMREVLRGIAAFAQHHREWIVDCYDLPAGQRRQILDNYVGDGVIVSLADPHVDPAMVKAVKKFDCPVVNVQAETASIWANTVSGDNQAIGRLGAEYLIDLGSPRLAFVWQRGLSFSEQRRLGFVKAAESNGFEVEQVQVEQIGSFLDRLAGDGGGPLGLMVYDDHPTPQVIAGARARQIQVPDDLAVLSAGNDVVRCELANPSISSIEGSMYTCGYEAASLLNRLMDGEAGLDHPMFIPPLGVVVRQSTDSFVEDDTQVLTALQFIRNHLSESIGVDDICQATQVSRRTLEIRFKAKRGRTIQAEIWHQRVRMAKRLLRRDSRSLLDIALDCGFASAGAFSTIFRRQTGLPPSAYRRGHTESP